MNRFGSGDARIEIVYAERSNASPAESELSQRRERTLTLLQMLSQRPDGRFDASPASLERLPADERQAAFTPPPTILPVSEILFDAWALTSVQGKMPGRPPVADWLHGIAEWEPSQTYVAWRSEVGLINEELQDADPPEDLLEDYPLKPHELLRDTTRRVSEHLAKIAERHPDLPAWVVDSNGVISVRKLDEVVSRDNPKKDMLDLGDYTVLLPPGAGGLGAKGMLDGNAAFDDQREYDVADKWLDEKDRPRRCRMWDSDIAPDGMRQVRVIDTKPEADDEADEARAPVRRRWQWYVRPRRPTMMARGQLDRNRNGTCIR